jgi:[acyl-carrier-protein] S-malonyltransferase
MLGAQRVVPVAVGGAFHTPFMASARPRLRKAIRAATFREPEVPVVANVDALPHKTADDWQGLTSAQLCSPVRWRQSILRLAGLTGNLVGGFPGLSTTTEAGMASAAANQARAAAAHDGERLFIELGSGGVLTGLTRRILPGATAISVAVPGDLDLLVEAISGDSPLHTYAAAHHGEHLYVSERMVISPCAGVFEPAATTANTTPAAATAAAAPGGEGKPIHVGTILGHVGNVEVCSPFAGWLMGMLALPGERVQSGQPVAWLRAS